MHQGVTELEWVEILQTTIQSDFNSRESIQVYERERSLKSLSVPSL
jgi:hypothetical protein